MSSTIERFALALQHAPRTDDKTLFRVVQKLAAVGEGLSLKEAREISAAETNNARSISDEDLRYSDRVIEESRALGIRIYSAAHPNYPNLLRALKTPPPVIHLRGNVDDPDELMSVAVVGTRKVTHNGAKIANRIAAFLSEKGWTVISGLALGIDAAAHEGALSAGDRRTIAILAHGLDAPTPKANADLGMRILDAGGAWISEHPVGTRPLRHHFVPRNRIQVGLSCGSIIVEAEERSGSISQAHFCLELNRPLFAVVPQDDENKLQLRSSGTQMLVFEKGAFPIYSRDDYPQVLTLLERSRHVLYSRWVTHGPNAQGDVA